MVISFAIGNYQIKQAKGYIFEHLKPSILDDDELEFTVELCSTEKDLVRVRFASRHSNSRNYIATVQYDNDDDDEPIKGWFCTCSAGARVIGCCAHVTALIWHLGVSRGEITSSDDPTSANNLLLHVNDCIQYSNSDSSDEESSDSSQID